MPGPWTEGDRGREQDQAAVVERGEGVQARRVGPVWVHNVKEVGEKKTFALVLYHYTMVKEGALVKWRLGGNASQANGHSQFGATPSPQPRSTPPTVSSTPSLRPPPSKVAPSPTNLSSCLTAGVGTRSRPRERHGRVWTI